MRRRSSTALALAVSGLIVAAVVAALTWSPNPARTVLVGSTPTTTNAVDPNYVLAVAELGKLLALTPLPPGAAPLHGRPPPSVATPVGLPGVPDTNHFIDRYRLWTVPMTPQQSIAWLDARTPPGLRPGSSGYQQSTGVTIDEVGWGATDAAAYEEPELGVGVTATPGGSIWRVDAGDIWITSGPIPYRQSGPSVHVSISAGCPASVARYDDVSNTPSLGLAMLPPASPTAGLICRYRGLNQPDPTGTLARSIPLDATQAQHLARVVTGVSTGSTGNGVTSCPNDTGGADIIVFAYPGRPDVDLWYHNSGCEGFDNGRISASEGGNPSFYQGFQPAVSALGG